MEVIEAIKTRRSIRKFQQKQVNAALLKKCVEAARLAPSSRNSQPLEFIAINSKELIPKIFKCIAWAASCPEAGPKENEQPQAYIAILINKEIGSSREQFDAGLAVENILLTAHGIGLASCCLGSINREKLKQILSIPERFELTVLIALGYPKQKSIAFDSSKTNAYHIENSVVHVPKKPLNEILHWNGFEKKSTAIKKKLAWASGKSRFKR